MMDNSEIAELGGEVVNRLNDALKAAHGDLTWARNIMDLLETENGAGKGKTTTDRALALVYAMFQFLVSISTVGTVLGNVTNHHIEQMGEAAKTDDDVSYHALSDTLIAMFSEILGGGTELEKLAHRLPDDPFGTETQ